MLRRKVVLVKRSLKEHFNGAGLCLSHLSVHVPFLASRLLHPFCSSAYFSRFDRRCVKISVYLTVQWREDAMLQVDLCVAFVFQEPAEN